MPCGGLRAAGWWGLSPGGLASHLARAVWCQALSLPWPPVLWGGQPGFPGPCVPGAVGVGVGAKHRSRSMRPCGALLHAVGWRKGVLLGGAFCRCEGRLSSGLPPPGCPPSGQAVGSAAHVLLVRVCGCGGPALSAWLACPVGAACRVGGGGPSPGGVAFHRCEGPLVSGAVSSPAARAAGVPRSVSPGCGWCGHGNPAPAPERARLRAVVACSGDGGGRPRGGAFRCCQGRLRSGASPPRLPALWAGSRGPLPTCCGRRCAGVRGQNCLLGLHALWGLRAAGVVGALPGGDGLPML